MPIDKRSGPGGVSASYGVRSTKNVYRTDKTYDDLITDSDGNIYAGGKKIVGDEPAAVPTLFWTAAEAVYESDVRRLPTGERIICVVSGTTGATAPTISYGAAPSALTDNTASWWPLDINFDSYTDNTSTSSLTIYNFHNAPQYFFNGSAPNRFSPGGSGNTTQSFLWSVTNGSTADNGFGANGRIGLYATREFETDSDILDIGYLSGVTGQIRERIQVYVNGKPLFSAPLKPSATGSSRHFKVRLGVGRGWKNVTIASYGVFLLQYVGIPSYASIRYPSNPGTVIGMFTDSWGDTESPSFRSVEDDFSPSVGRRLGFSHVVAATVGGTSYSLDSGGRKNLNDLLDLNDIRGLNLDAIVVGQGFNAGPGGAVPGTEAASASSSWTKLRNASPGAPMVIIGPWYRQSASGASHDSIMAALRTAFLAKADPNSVFLNPFDGSITTGRGYVAQAATGAWLPDSVNTWAIGVDGAHPSPAGRVYLTDKVSREIRVALNALGWQKT